MRHAVRAAVSFFVKGAFFFCEKSRQIISNNLQRVSKSHAGIRRCRLCDVAGMRTDVLLMGIQANRLYEDAVKLSGPLTLADSERKNTLLRQAIDLRISEWEEWLQSPDLSAKIGAAQAAQALGVYYTESCEYQKARDWLEKALEHCPLDTVAPRRYWYLLYVLSSLHSFVREQLVRVQELSRAELPHARAH